jgi:heme/copper-type cytochrome/quinol oxidase subunit 1
MSPPTTVAPARPELTAEGLAERRPRWVEAVTSSDHKDVGKILLGASLGFLALATVELVLMRLQLAIPENTFLTPETFNRLLSVYGASAIFLFGLPFAMGLYYYLVPLQIGARGTALPRLGQTGLWLFIGGAFVLYVTFFFTPPEAGVNPLPPLSELTFIPNDGIDAWLTATGLVTLGLLLLAINLVTTLRTMRAPGMAWRRLPVLAWAGAISSWLLLVAGPLLLAAITMLMADRNFDGVFFSGAGGAPLLWQHLSWIFLTASYMLIVITAFAVAAEIVPAFSRRRLAGRGTVIGSLAAVAVVGTLAWLQNMLTAPVSIGWMYYGMTMALVLIVPFGLLFCNLLATMAGGVLRLRAPMLFALGALSLMSIGLASEIGHSMVAVAWQLKNTTDATAATHYALVGGAVFGGFAALHFWYPKITGRVMGESLGRLSFWTMLVGANLAFFPLFLAGVQGQVVDAYEYLDGTGVGAYNLIATIGSLVLALGIVLALANAILSLKGGRPAGHDPWGAESLEWFALSPPPPHNFDVLPDVRSHHPLHDIREAVEDRAGAGAAAGEGQPVA